MLVPLRDESFKLVQDSGMAPGLKIFGNSGRARQRSQDGRFRHRDQRSNESLVAKARQVTGNVRNKRGNRVLSSGMLRKHREIVADRGGNDVAALGMRSEFLNNPISERMASDVARFFPQVFRDFPNLSGREGFDQSLEHDVPEAIAAHVFDLAPQSIQQLTPFCAVDCVRQRENELVRFLVLCERWRCLDHLLHSLRSLGGCTVLDHGLQLWSRNGPLRGETLRSVVDEI
mmetsp:Transcript_46411/g.143262  ORF Transcript_46411/g.143262 Transcript_46411/m.143262 type:complete len:231 (+) Transcript_46411:1007-1699(+)